MIITCAAATVSVIVCCAAEAESRPNLGLDRKVVAEAWDTVWIAGSRNVNDTLFGHPYEVELRDGLLAVRDIDRQAVVALDLDGNRLWITGGQGAGPREFGHLSDIEFDVDGSVLAFDARNRRIADLSRDGRFLRVRNLEFFEAPYDMLLPLQDSLILAAQVANNAIGVVERENWQIGRTYSFPWPDQPLSDSLRLEGHWARHPSEPGTRVFAFGYGPGFIIWRGGEVEQHYYIDPIPFAYKMNTELMRMGADSARYGALAVEAVGDEIFFLFGGRPHRMEHPEEPTRWLDVYGWDGRYRRSYLLPFDTDGMATDGHVVYALIRGPYPQLVALTPVGASLGGGEQVEPPSS